jgi:hypothetical protein
MVRDFMQGDRLPGVAALLGNHLDEEARTRVGTRRHRLAASIAGERQGTKKARSTSQIGQVGRAFVGMLGSVCLEETPPSGMTTLNAGTSDIGKAKSPKSDRAAHSLW